MVFTSFRYYLPW